MLQIRRHDFGSECWQNLNLSEIVFRITKIFADGALDIYKIEGTIADDSLQAWSEALSGLHNSADRKILLDFCQVRLISVRALEILATHLTTGTHVMNPGIDVRNILHTAGLASRVLE